MDNKKKLQSSVSMNKSYSKPPRAVYEFSRHVCQILVPTETGFESNGTGFLIGPDLVLTCFHVIEDYSANDLVCRFDVRRSELGKISAGLPNIKVKRIAATSPYSEMESEDKYSSESNTHPAGNELDYAVLRLTEDIGNETVEIQQNFSGVRGWIPLLAERPLIRLNSDVSILQHPKGSAMLAAFGPLAENQPQPGTRVQYKVKTGPGSSGAPCFVWNNDEDSKLVPFALHNYGDPSWYGEHSNYNHGIPLWIISKDVRERNPEIDLEQSPQATGKNLEIQNSYFDRIYKILELLKSGKASKQTANVSNSSGTEVTQNARKVMNDTTKQSADVKNSPGAKVIQNIVNKKGIPLLVGLFLVWMIAGSISYFGPFSTLVLRISEEGFLSNIAEERTSEGKEPNYLTDAMGGVNLTGLSGKDDLFYLNYGELLRFSDGQGTKLDPTVTKSGFRFDDLSKSQINSGITAGFVGGNIYQFSQLNEKGEHQILEKASISEILGSLLKIWPKRDSHQAMAYPKLLEELALEANQALIPDFESKPRSLSVTASSNMEWLYNSDFLSNRTEYIKLLEIASKIFNVRLTGAEIRSRREAILPNTDNEVPKLHLLFVQANRSANISLQDLINRGKNTVAEDWTAIEEVYTEASFVFKRIVESLKENPSKKYTSYLCRQSKLAVDTRLLIPTFNKFQLLLRDEGLRSVSLQSVEEGDPTSLLAILKALKTLSVFQDNVRKLHDVKDEVPAETCLSDILNAGSKTLNWNQFFDDGNEIRDNTEWFQTAWRIDDLGENGIASYAEPSQHDVRDFVCLKTQNNSLALARAEFIDLNLTEYDFLSWSWLPKVLPPGDVTDLNKPDEQAIIVALFFDNPDPESYLLPPLLRFYLENKFKSNRKILNEAGFTEADVSKLLEAKKPLLLYYVWNSPDVKPGEKNEKGGFARDIVPGILTAKHYIKGYGMPKDNLIQSVSVNLKEDLIKAFGFIDLNNLPTLGGISVISNSQVSQQKSEGCIGPIKFSKQR